jgi:hypothetical protein
VQRLPIGFTTSSVNCDFDEAIKICTLEKTNRQKVARFRWFLAYTLLNNCCLYNQRKCMQSRLNLLRINQSNQSVEQQFTAIVPE